MANALLQFQNDIKNYLETCQTLHMLTERIVKEYWTTDANVKVSAATNGTDPVTVDSKLTKTQYTNGITMATQLNNFFDNVAVNQADYLAYVFDLINGNGAASAILSAPTENIGNELKTAALLVSQLYFAGAQILKFYESSGLDDVMTVMTDILMSSISNITLAHLNSAIGLILDFVYMCGNATVTQLDRCATVTLWRTVPIVNA
jgi:hypothetical protein